jgi:hypothetical protein
VDIFVVFKLFDQQRVVLGLLPCEQHILGNLNRFLRFVRSLKKPEKRARKVKQYSKY